MVQVGLIVILGDMCLWPETPRVGSESSSLVLVINDTKLLMSCVKWFKLGISNTCDEGTCGMEWWPQDHKEMVHCKVQMARGGVNSLFKTSTRIT
jgi:hypothetical protein